MDLYERLESTPVEKIIIRHVVDACKDIYPKLKKIADINDKLLTIQFENTYIEEETKQNNRKKKSKKTIYSDTRQLKMNIDSIFDDDETLNLLIDTSRGIRVVREVIHRVEAYLWTTLKIFVVKNCLLLESGDGNKHLVKADRKNYNSETTIKNLCELRKLQTHGAGNKELTKGKGSIFGLWCFVVNCLNKIPGLPDFMFARKCLSVLNEYEKVHVAYLEVKKTIEDTEEIVASTI
jgi:hypothetical protein